MTEKKIIRHKKTLLVEVILKKKRQPTLFGNITRITNFSFTKMYLNVISIIFANMIKNFV